MEATKTPVQITQDLLALITARKEYSKTRTDGGGARGDSGGAPKDDELTKLLTDELSLYGDAVGGTADHEGRYFRLTEGRGESAEAAPSGGELNRAFQEALDNILKDAPELPESLERIIEKIRSTS